MRSGVALFLIGGLLFVAAPVTAQVCGDANGDGELSIGDVAKLADAVFRPEIITSDPDFHLTEADCDGRAGITVADVAAVCDARYRGDDHLDCSAGLSYSLTLSESDTVFIPRASNVGSGVTLVELPVLMSLTDVVEGAHISLHTDPSVADHQFYLSDVVNGNPSSVIVTSTWQWYTGNGDSTVMQAFELANDAMAGLRSTYCTLQYSRAGTESCDIVPTELIRTDQLRITVERNGDLFLPVIVYYEVVLPDPVLSVDPVALSFTAVSGDGPGESYDITFSSTSGPVTFDLDISASWITAVSGQAPNGPFTTPVTFTVQADATTLFPGSYAGTISATNVSPAETIVDVGTVAVDFTVQVPANLPWGDVTCDGRVSLADIALIVDCVFIDPRPVPDCR